MNKYPWLDEFLLSFPGTVKDYKAEWGWYRYKIGDKQFAATCYPGEGHSTIEHREIVSLKCEQELSVTLREEYPDIVPGFYLNKFTWISVYLDGEVSDELLMDLCRASYEGVFAKLTKKAQAAIKAAAEA